MYQRKLAVGEVLWREGEPALSFGVVESGKVGVSSGRRLIGVLFPKMVLGESALLGVDGPSSYRTASVHALEADTVVAEYPASIVRESFGVGIPRLVLRTLCGQICRNSLIVLASHSHVPAVKEALLGTIQGIGRCEKQLKRVTSWQDFMTLFRLLYHQRDGSNAILAALFPDDDRSPETLLRASETIREIFRAPDLVEYLEQFLRAETERRARA